MKVSTTTLGPSLTNGILFLHAGHDGGYRPSQWEMAMVGPQLLGQDQIKTGFSCGSSPLTCPLGGNTPFRVFRIDIRIEGTIFQHRANCPGRRSFCGDGADNILDAIDLVITACVLQFKVRLQPFRPQVAIVPGRKRLTLFGSAF